MRKQKITAWLLLLATAVFSQVQSLDSLKLVAQSLRGLPKVVALNELASALLPDNADQSKAVAEQALDLAIQLQDEKGKAAALDNLGQAFQSKLDYKRAMTAFLEALKIRDHTKDERGQAISRTNVGRVFFLMEDFTQAEDYLVKALEIWGETGERPGMAKAHAFLGDLYLAMKIYGKAQENYRRSMELKLAEGDANGAAATAFLLGDICMELGNGESAVSYFRTALDLYRDVHDFAGSAAGYSRIALVLLGQMDFEAALEHCRLAAGFWEQAGDDFGLAECNKNFGLIYLALGSVDKAKAYFHQTAEGLAKLPVQAHTPSLYAEIADGFARAGDFENAYRFQQAFSLTRHQVFDQEKAKALLDLTTKYESEFAAREQQQRITLLELKNANAQRVKYSLLAVIGLIGVLLGTVYLSYRRKKRDNQLLVAKNEEIEWQKQEIDHKNAELQHKNLSLDLLNKKLVDEIAERENIERSSFARDRFLATMSHEMRTPLNIITGLTHILLDSNPRPDQAEQLRTLQYSANDLLVFINDVLDFSKIEAGKLDLESREFIPAATLQEIKQHFEEKSSRKNLTFKYGFDKKIPEKMLGDNARLHQILTYVLNNLLHHTSTGSVALETSLEELNSREAKLRIEIEGTDGGLGRKMPQGMFRPMSDRDEDSGFIDSEQLSLAITKRLIELQNGKLEVITQPGVSTIFVIRLLFRLVNEDKKSATDKPVHDYSHLAGTRILVVEDNKINQLVVAKILRKLGIDVCTANNGQEALDLYETEDFDLILMDIQMPVMDGYRTTAEIRTHPVIAKRDIPIIALTASAFLTEKEKAVLFGMNDHVGKPFSPDELLEKISVCLEIYRNVS